MFARVIKRVLIPSAVVVGSDNNINNVPKEVKNDKFICRPSELPVYRPDPPSAPVIYETPVKEETTELKPPEFLTSSIASVRKSITDVCTELGKYEKVAENYVHEKRANADDLIKYLREEDNVAPKAGAIAIGGLTGLILGLRGGFFKKLVFASAGALGMASVCYPVEAAEYSQIGINEAKKYIHISYNFCVGAKKDDPPPELPSLPKLPTSLSEAWQTVAKSAASLVSDKSNGDEDENEEEAKKKVTTDSMDPLAIISDSYDKSHEACHCPVGECLGQHDEYATEQQKIDAKAKALAEAKAEEEQANAEKLAREKEMQENCEEKIIEIDEECF